MTKHIVTGIRPFDFTNENGERLQGVKVFYLDSDLEDTSSGKGYTSLNLSLTGDQLAKFKSVPGLYDLDFKQVSDKYGKPSLKLRNAAFLKPINFEALIG